eukprot:353282-Pelagomonas_calceolata.AAC.1
MVHACPNNCLAVLDLAAVVCVSPGLPIYNFEVEVHIGKFKLWNNSKLAAKMRLPLAGRNMKVAVASVLRMAE